MSILSSPVRRINRAKNRKPQISKYRGEYAKIALQQELKTTRSLLTAGMIAGILFILVPLFEMFIRPGFDLKRHAISVLSLGDLGWIQITNFLVTGMLTIACAIGMRRVISSRPSGCAGYLLHPSAILEC